MRWADENGRHAERAAAAAAAGGEPRPPAEDVVPDDVEQLLAALERRVGELSRRRPLAALRTAARIGALARESGLRAVRAARADRVSWEAVGRALGVSRQAAHERFARHVRD